MYERIQIPTLSLADLCREICERLDGTILNHEDRYLTYSYPGFLYCRNFILSASESEIEPILKEIRQNMENGMPGGISFTKEGMPENTEEYLRQNGFQPFICQTGMIFDLEKGFSENVDENIAVLPDDRIIDWSRTIADGFPKPREDEPYIALNKCDKVLTYGYMVNGTIASTGLLMMDPELSGIHEISTLVAHRGRGYATAIIIRMLQDLKARGIQSVSLQASDAGKQHVYEPLGFEVVSTIPTWIPEQS